MTFWDGLKGMTPLDVFMYANIVIKLIVILVIFNGVAALILGLIRIATKGTNSGLLTGIGAGALIFSVLGALYSGYTTYYAIKITGTTNLAVIAPSIAEAALCLGSGILVMAIAAFGNWGAPKAKG